MLTAPVVALLLATGQPALFLAEHPEFRIVSLRDAVEPPDQDTYIKQGYFHPMTVADIDGDGIDDLLVVVVQWRTKPRRYGVVAFSGTRTGFAREPKWVVRPIRELIRGVAASSDDGRVYPLFCVECDTNSFLRWNGKEFESKLFVVNEPVLLVGPFVSLDQPPGATVPLLAEPRSGASTIGTVKGCTGARVSVVGPRDGTRRWYRVDIEGQGSTLSGWITDDDICGIGGCCLA